MSGDGRSADDAGMTTSLSARHGVREPLVTRSSMRLRLPSWRTSPRTESLLVQPSGAERTKHAELVARRVGHHHECLLTLTDVDPAGAEALQPRHLGALVIGS